MSKEKVTKEIIANWKSLHGEVFEVSVEGKLGYLKKPERSAMGMFLATREDNPIKSAEYLLKHCWLGGDEEIKDNDAYFLGTLQVLDELIEVKSVELKKL